MTRKYVLIFVCLIAFLLTLMFLYRKEEPIKVLDIPTGPLETNQSITVQPSAQSTGKD